MRKLQRIEKNHSEALSKPGTPKPARVSFGRSLGCRPVFIEFYDSVKRVVCVVSEFKNFRKIVLKYKNRLFFKTMSSFERLAILSIFGFACLEWQKSDLKSEILALFIAPQSLGAFFRPRHTLLLWSVGNTWKSSIGDSGTLVSSSFRECRSREPFKTSLCEE